MSYRLIDANTLAANCRQVNDMPCIYADLPNGLDGNHYIIEQSENSSRWFELFSTPERTVRTLSAIGGQYLCDKTAQDCDNCPLEEAPCRLNRDKPEESKLLEWLKGDA